MTYDYAAMFHTDYHGIAAFFLLWIRCTIMTLAFEVAIRYSWWWFRAVDDEWKNRLVPHLLGVAVVATASVMFALYSVTTGAVMIPTTRWRLAFYLGVDIWLVGGFALQLFVCWRIFHNLTIFGNLVEFVGRVLIGFALYLVLYTTVGQNM